MKKVARAIALAGVVYVIPLVANLEMLVSVPALLACAGALTLMLSQPDISRKDVAANSMTDRSSALTILLAGILAHLLPVIEWKTRGFPGSTGWPTAIQVAGVIVAAAGIAFRIYSIRVLGKYFTSTVQIQGDHELVTAGPYARVRHPSYVGALTAIVGHALILGAPISAGVCGVIMLVVYRYRINVEEAALRGAFGERYTSYEAQTHRLIPRVW